MVGPGTPDRVLDERRPPCRCEPWKQRWLPERPERCLTCGGMFPARTVPARRLREGEK